MRRPLESFSQFLLTEGKVLDAAAARLRKGLAANLKELTGRYGDGFDSPVTLGLAFDFRYRFLERAERLFNKRAGVPNAEFLNWFADRMVSQIDVYKSAFELREIYNSFEHCSDWLVSTNRINSFSFARFDRMQLAVDSIEAMEKKDQLAKSARQAAAVATAGLSPAEQAEVGKRQSFASGKRLGVIITSEPGEATTVVDCGDGWAWQDINKSYCEKEGASMMHCGNVVGQTQTHQRIFSLRKNVGGNDWIPFLTFIYNPQNKSLGEMKASGNTKPPAKYHPMIVKLLSAKDKKRKPLIEWVKGGGYRPEANFQLSDLSAADIAKLKKSNKALFADRSVVLEFKDINDFAENMLMPKKCRSNLQDALSALENSRYREYTEYGKHVDVGSLVDDGFDVIKAACANDRLTEDLTKYLNYLVEDIYERNDEGDFNEEDFKSMDEILVNPNSTLVDKFGAVQTILSTVTDSRTRRVLSPIIRMYDEVYADRLEGEVSDQIRKWVKNLGATLTVPPPRGDYVPTEGSVWYPFKLKCPPTFANEGRDADEEDFNIEFEDFWNVNEAFEIDDRALDGVYVGRYELFEHGKGETPMDGVLDHLGFALDSDMY